MEKQRTINIKQKLQLRKIELPNIVKRNEICEQRKKLIKELQKYIKNISYHKWYAWKKYNDNEKIINNLKRKTNHRFGKNQIKLIKYLNVFFSQNKPVFQQYKNIEKLTGIDEHQIKKSIKSLEQKQIIFKLNVRSNKGKYNAWIIPFPDEKQKLNTLIDLLDEKYWVIIKEK